MSVPAPAGAPGAAETPPVIMVVDNNAAKRLAVSAMLAPLRYEIVEADSGRSALRHVLQRTFALILMDVRMPIMDGYETAQLIRQRNKTRLTPIIFVTAYARADVAVTAAYEAGGVDFIFAPVVPEVLRAKVATFTELFVKTQALEGSLESITALNEALREAELRTRAVLEHVGDGILTVGQTGRIESANRAAQLMFGYTEHELAGRPLEQVVRRSDDEAPRAAVANQSRTRATDAVERIEVNCRRQDGSGFRAEVEMSAVRIAERQLTIASIRDISERDAAKGREREHAETLRLEAQRDRAAFDEAPIGSIIARSDGRIERVNAAICRMTGYSAEELIGTYALELTHPDDRLKAERASESVLSGMASTARYEKRYVLRDGSILEAFVAVTAIRDDEHHVVQLFAQIEDVTAIREATRELEQSQVEVLERLAAAAEFRDDDTGQHTRRVGETSVAIARVIGLPEADVELIRLAAPLHDLGKIAVPDAVLSKPGKLTIDEFEQMKAHTTVGATLLEGGANPLLAIARQIALTHHEKWDGTGYPAGIAGARIPIVGRIVAVADVFDALTHTRPYKAAWSVEDAISEMISHAGRHFDPHVLAAFLDALGRPGDDQVGAAPRPQSTAAIIGATSIDGVQYGPPEPTRRRDDVVAGPLATAYGDAMAVIATDPTDGLKGQLTQATRDPLTALWTRGAFDDQYQGLIAAPAAGTPALLMIDIDRFALINDDFGHGAGDRALVAVAQEIRRAVRPGDFVARYGGDEFIVALLDTGPEDAARISERIRSQIAACLGDPKVTVSVGVAIPDHGDAQRATLEAERALGEAKAHGRNQVAFA